LLERVRLRLVHGSVDAFGEELAVAEHRVDRRAQVVGDAREEPAPRREGAPEPAAATFEGGTGPLELGRLLAEARRLPAGLGAERGALHRSAGVARHDLEQAAIAGGVESRGASGQQ